MAGPPTPLPRHSAALLERNLRLVPVHKVVASALVWTPILILFNRARFGLDGAVFLAGLYYLFVVALEVPSGWMSDRFGRVLTLRAAAISWVAGFAFFTLGNDRMWLIALGYLGIASGFAALSGTNVSFHFDSLEALGRADEFASRESRVAALGYASSAVGAVVGGLLGLIDLRIPFGVAIALALIQFGVTSFLVEPPQTGEQNSSGLLRHVGECLSYLRRPAMAWLFAYGIAMVTLEHVAFTPLQPWLTEATGSRATDLGATPLISGLVIAGVAGVGSLAARSTGWLTNRLGVVTTLIGLGVLSAIVVTAMTASTSLLVLGFIAFRSVQGAAAPVVLNAAIAPRTQQSHRATLLSLNSLGGRLGYGLILLFVADSIEDDLQPALRTLTSISWTLVALLIATALIAQRRDASL